MKIDDVITHISHAEDLPFLKTKLFDVNMRLFESSIEYRNLIDHCCQVIKNRCAGHYEDYKRPHGMSGANCAIPFNIIGILINRNTDREWVKILINPAIIDYSGNEVEAISNCGSIRLDIPIKIIRHEICQVEYHNTMGIQVREWFDRKDGSFTVQHEIDHNLGILITDYK